MDELKSFRDQWAREINARANLGTPSSAVSNDKVSASSQSLPSANSIDDSPGCGARTLSDIETPYPFQFTDSLLRSWQETPYQNSRKKRKRFSVPNDSTTSDDRLEDSGALETIERATKRSLVDIFIDDLNELDSIPFFDIDLPKEIALKIFAHLDMKDLCSCAQVSKSWQKLSEDSLLWEKIYHFHASTFTGQNLVDSCDNWKETVRRLFTNTKALQTHWREHKCHLTYYHHARGGVLTSAHSLADYIVAGYSNGQIKLWNVVNDESQTLECCDSSLVLIDEDNDNSLGASENSVTSLKLCSSNFVIAGYNHGQVQWWNLVNQVTDAIEYPGYQVKDTQINSTIGYSVIFNVSNQSCMIKVLDLTNSSQIEIDSIQIKEGNTNWTLPKQLMVPLPYSSEDNSNLIYLSRDKLSLHNCSKGLSGFEMSSSLIEEFYGTHFTCMEASKRHLCIGLTSHLGLQAEYKVRCYDPQTLVHTTDLRGHTSQVTCVDSSFDKGFLLSTGCHDRRVRLYDSRMPLAAVATLMGHTGSVVCIQADDWKIISGDTDGYVIVWDQRKGSKLWESQSRHPVKYLRFSSDHLVTANIPVCRDWESYDSDRMTHLRFRGRLQVSDFSVDQQTTGIPSICSSSYDMPEGSTYNLSLITPYDSI